MKIQVLRLIEDALIGGRSGEMAFVENNPFIAEVFRQYINETKKDFKSFLLDCINNEDSNTNEIVNYKYEDIKKTYCLNKCNKEYKEYRQIEDEIAVLQKRKIEKLKEIATIINPQLADISTYEIKYKEWGNELQFKINVSLVKDILAKD